MTIQRTNGTEISVNEFQNIASLHQNTNALLQIHAIFDTYFFLKMLQNTVNTGIFNDLKQKY